MSHLQLSIPWNYSEVSLNDIAKVLSVCAVFLHRLIFLQKFLSPSVVLVVPFIKSALLEKVGHYDLIRRIGLLNKKWELQVHTISYLMIYMFCSIFFISFQFGIGKIFF